MQIWLINGGINREIRSFGQNYYALDAKLTGLVVKRLLREG